MGEGRSFGTPRTAFNRPTVASTMGSLGAFVGAWGIPALLILIGGIALLEGLAHEWISDLLRAIGLPDIGGGGFAIFIGLLLIGAGIAVHFAGRDSGE